MVNKGLGYIPDLMDFRDYKLSAIEPPKATLPAKVDLRPLGIPVYDQGNLGSCTANASGVMFRYIDKQDGGNENPSRLYIYYESRKMEGWQAQDSGAYLRDTLKVLASEGAAPEEDWPYDISKFALVPPQKAYNDAKAHLALVYASVDQNLNAMQSCLASGFPLILGFSLFTNFYSIGSDGLMRMPSGNLEGGHAVTLVGYLSDSKRFIALNSWGTQWGDGGFFYPPFDYFTNPDLADDLWTIRKVEENTPTPPTPPQPPTPVVPKPVITKIKVKKNGKMLLISGLFGTDVKVYIDSAQSLGALLDPTTYVLHPVQQLTSGQHQVYIVSNGQTSDSYAIEV
jgi:C1A family cysteine protease